MKCILKQKVQNILGSQFVLELVWTWLQQEMWKPNIIDFLFQIMFYAKKIYTFLGDFAGIVAFGNNLATMNFLWIT